MFKATVAYFDRQSNTKEIVRHSEDKPVSGPMWDNQLWAVMAQADDPFCWEIIVPLSRLAYVKYDCVDCIEVSPS